MITRVVVDPIAPDRAVLERAAAIIRAGGVIALPTDTLYGLAADPFNAQAVARIFAVKGRAPTRALPLIAFDTAQVDARIGTLPILGRLLADRFWPGPLTLLVSARETLAPGASSEDRRVGVRVPAHAVARELCRACGRPLTATSANISGQAASGDPGDVANLPEQIDLLLDAGKTPGGAPSTIVDVTGDDVRLIRAGAIPWEEVQACLPHA